MFFICQIFRNGNISEGLHLCASRNRHTSHVPKCAHSYHFVNNWRVALSNPCWNFRHTQETNIVPCWSNAGICHCPTRSHQSSRLLTTTHDSNNSRPQPTTVDCRRPTTPSPYIQVGSAVFHLLSLSPPQWRHWGVAVRPPPLTTILELGE